MTPQDPVLRALQDEHQAQALLGLGFDYLMAQPLDRFVTPERVLLHLDRALAGPLFPHILGEHVRGFLDREPERAAARGDRVEDYLTPEAQEVLRELTERPVRLDPEFLQGLVQQEAVRHLLRTVVEDSIHRFVKNVKTFTLPGGRGLLGKVAAQVETQLQRAATTFVQGSMDRLLKLLAQTLSTEDSAKRLGRLNRAGFEALLTVESADLLRAVHRLPLDDLLALVPLVLRHNVQRAEIREAILAEAREVLAFEGTRTLAEVLDPESLQTWRQTFIEVGTPLLNEFVQTAGVTDWLGSLDR